MTSRVAIGRVAEGIGSGISRSEAGRRRLYEEAAGGRVALLLSSSRTRQTGVCKATRMPQLRSPARRRSRFGSVPLNPLPLWLSYGAAGEARLRRRVGWAAATMFPVPGAASPIAPAGCTRTQKRAARSKQG